MIGIGLGPLWSGFIYVFNLQFLCKNLIPVSIYFDIGQYGARANRTFLLIMRQFICAPNLRSVNRDAVQTWIKSMSSQLFHNSRFIAIRDSSVKWFFGLVQHIQYKKESEFFYVEPIFTEIWAEVFIYFPPLCLFSIYAESIFFKR
jgi:hypothetical protein